MRHKVTYTVKVHGQGGASNCLDVLRASTIELNFCSSEYEFNVSVCIQYRIL